MAWYSKLIQKLNPAQAAIQDNEGTQIGTDANLTIIQAFDRVETVNRGVNMIVRAASSLDFDIKDKVNKSLNARYKKTDVLKALVRLSLIYPEGDIQFVTKY